MTKILNKILDKAKNSQVKIIFPETKDLRTLKALEQITRLKLCQPVLIGNQAKIIQRTIQNSLKIDFSNCQFIDPDNLEIQKKLAKILYQKRKNKGLTEQEANKLVKDLNYFSTLCLQAKLGQAIISGATSSTASTLRPAFQIIGTKPGNKLISSSILITPPNGRPLLFADCAVNPNPTASELAEIAYQTAQTALSFQLKPKIAFLSFSTHGSAHTEATEKVAAATKIFQKKYPQIPADGEIQADAALVPEIAKFKSANSKIKGDANILIFPDLQSGNISYKLVERLAGAEAIGVIIQGLKQPVNDLSRGCKPSDIVHLTAITALEIKNQKK